MRLFFNVNITSHRRIKVEQKQYFFLLCIIFHGISFNKPVVGFVDGCLYACSFVRIGLSQLIYCFSLRAH